MHTRWITAKKRVREMLTREAAILAVVWHRATLTHCIAKSSLAIIHTQPWTISHTHTHNTHRSVFNVPSVPCSQPYCSTWYLGHVKACSTLWDKWEKASVQSLVGVPATQHATCVVNTYRRCTLHAKGKEDTSENKRKQRLETQTHARAYETWIFFKRTF